MISDPSECMHLSVAQVMEIHAAVIRHYGGAPGLREEALLYSATAAPQATFGGVSVFSDTVEVAAAYMYYLCSSHPFVDGNKRVALGACLIFLEINGYAPIPDGEDWENFTFAVASGMLARDEITGTLRKLLS